MTKRVWNDAVDAWEEALKQHEKGDIPLAVQAYEFAARLGHAEAQNNLANILDDESYPEDPEGAVFWYSQAAKNGCRSAAWNLAKHFERRGDMSRSWHWVRVAAEMGDLDARDLLESGPAKFKRHQKPH